MPYEIRHPCAQCPASKPWGVVNRATGKKVGCHSTQKEASAQMRALYANVSDAKK